MTTFEILRRYGTPALVRFVALVAVFLALHLVRLLLLAMAAVLEIAMRRVDSAVTTRLSTPDMTAAGTGAWKGGDAR